MVCWKNMHHYLLLYCNFSLRLIVFVNIYSKTFVTNWPLNWSIFHIIFLNISRLSVELIEIFRVISKPTIILIWLFDVLELHFLYWVCLYDVLGFIVYIFCTWLGHYVFGLCSPGVLGFVPSGVFSIFSTLVGVLSPLFPTWFTICQVSLIKSYYRSKIITCDFLNNEQTI